MPTFEGQLVDVESPQAGVEAPPAPVFPGQRVGPAVPEPRRFLREGEPVTTPLAPPSGEITPQQDIEQTGTLVFPEPIDPVIRSAADAGVDFTNPAPNRAIALTGFAFDEKEKMRAVEIGLMSKFGFKVPVRRGKQTGAIEFQDPVTGRFSLAMPPGETSSLRSLEGPGIVMASELGGGTLGAFTGANPITATFGAASGAVMGELMRIQIGKNAGINRNVSDADMISSALKEGGISLAGSVAAGTMLKTAKFMLDIVKGRAFTESVLRDLEIDINVAEADKIQQLVNQRIQGERLQFTLGQKTNDEDILAMEQFFKKGREFSKEFKRVEEGQIRAVGAFNDEIHSSFRTRLTPQETLEAVRSRVQSGLDRHRRMAEVPVEMAEKNLDDAITSIRTRPLESIGPTLRDIGDREFDVFTDWADKGAARLHQMAGGAEFIPNRFTVAAVNKLDKQVARALFKPPVGAQKSLIGQRVAGTESVPEELRVLRESITGEPQPETETILNKVFDPDAKFTFREAWEGLSALKRIVRDGSKGTSTEVPSIGAVKTLIAALNRDLHEGASKSALREEYTQFITRYRQEKIRLDEGTVAKIMRRDGNLFKVNDEKVFDEIFRRRGNTEAREIFNLVRNDPEALQGIREATGDLYRKKVISEGRVNLRAHEQFLSDYAEGSNSPMGVFFNKQEMQLIRRPGAMEKVLRARQARKDTVVAQLNNTLDAKLANLNNPGQLRRFVMEPGNANKTARVVEILESSPEVLRAVRADVRKDIAERITGEFIAGTNERVLNPSKLKDFLTGKSGERGHASNLRVLFGDRYVEDLGTLQKALAVAARESRHPNRSNTSFWNDTVKNLSRAYVGLFTRPGRFITALDRVRGRAANRLLFRAVVNPDEIREILALRGVDLRSKKAANVIGALGGTALLQDFE